MDNTPETLLLDDPFQVGKTPTLVLKHPIGRYLELTPDLYSDALQRWLGFRDYPNL